MNDANELLDTIYECFAECFAASDAMQRAGGQQLPGSRGGLIDSVFGMCVRERLSCPRCGVQSHVVAPHWEHMLVVNTAALTTLAALSGDGCEMGILLRQLFDQEQKACDRDIGGCGAALV